MKIACRTICDADQFPHARRRILEYVPILCRIANRVNVLFQDVRQRSTKQSIWDLLLKSQYCEGCFNNPAVTRTESVGLPVLEQLEAILETGTCSLPSPTFYGRK